MSISASPLHQQLQQLLIMVGVCHKQPQLLAAEYVIQLTCPSHCSVLTACKYAESITCDIYFRALRNGFSSKSPLAIRLLQFGIKILNDVVYILWVSFWHFRQNEELMQWLLLLFLVQVFKYWIDLSQKVLVFRFLFEKLCFFLCSMISCWVLHCSEHLKRSHW